ncbi:MAG: type IV pilus modification PilV family protein [Candidatus Xenobia bacterium]
MTGSRGTTMTDVIFLMMILSIAIIPISGLFPMGRVTVQKAKDIQTASFLARTVINQYRCNWPGDLLDTPSDLTAVPRQTVPCPFPTNIDGVQYDVATTLYDAQNRALTPPNTGFEIAAIDVQVTVSSNTLAQPVTYSTRIFKDMQEMQKL